MSHHTPAVNAESFVKNAWYVAATSAELAKGTVARRILNEPIFLYRDDRGSVVAMLDRCPHRRFPLSKGSIEQGGVRCGYHGLKFAPDGRCIDVPCQLVVNAGLQIRTFEVVELGDWVWIWMGKRRSDGCLPPQAPEFLHGAGWRRRQLFAERCNARASLFHDNLLDLTHLSYLHATNIGGSGVAQAKADVKVTDFGLSVRREMLDEKMAGLPLGRAVGVKGPIVRVMEQQFYPPALHITGSAFFFPDASGGPDKEAGSFRVLHALTPATATTTHYFQAYQRNFAQDDASCDEVMERVLKLPLAEDVMSAEVIESEISQAGDLEDEIHIAGDAIALRGRRLLKSLAHDGGGDQ